VDATVDRVRREQPVQRELVVRAQQGDAEAFSVLAAGAIDRLHGVAYRILRDQDAADDATQRALIDAWDHLDGLRDPDRFHAWTYRLVVHAAYKEIRREHAQHERVQMIRVGGGAVSDPGDDVARRDELEHAFRELSPEHRAVAVLHLYADLPQAEIADILGIPVGTVGSRLHHAARRLRAALERDAPGVLEGSTPSDARA
jgi:RNA polymerase sigma-70 factor (ECF subfamily)